MHAPDADFWDEACQQSSKKCMTWTSEISVCYLVSGQQISNREWNFGRKSAGLSGTKPAMRRSVRQAEERRACLTTLSQILAVVWFWDLIDCVNWYSYLFTYNTTSKSRVGLKDISKPFKITDPDYSALPLTVAELGLDWFMMSFGFTAYFYVHVLTWGMMSHQSSKVWDVCKLSMGYAW